MSRTDRLQDAARATLEQHRPLLESEPITGVSVVLKIRPNDHAIHTSTLTPSFEMHPEPEGVPGALCAPGPFPLPPATLDRFGNHSDA